MNFNNENDLYNFFKHKKLNKIFVITGFNSYKKSGAKNILNKVLEKKNLFFYFKKNFFPDILELKDIILKTSQFKPDLILAVGGGSVIDYAKITNVFKTSDNINEDILNSNFKYLKKIYKLAVIPTTAGSGAEVTSNAVIYIKGKKYSVESEKLKPDYYFLVPKLVIGAKKSIKSSAGFDAISQSIESIISRKANRQSIAFAKKSLELSFKKFEKFVNEPNLSNTRNMCVAATLSGKAISITKTTAPHALSYPFTSHFGISHGHAVSLTLNEFLKFNYKFLKYSDTKLNLKKKFDLIFKIAKVKNINELDQYLAFLKKKTKLENNFTKLGIVYDRDVSKIISGVNILRLSNNPINLDKTILKSVILDISKK
jgi:alcohol dehydrogenase|tara:strand:- start:10005 stop:11117 length:1113 start_codon:yes stop_codon:yes gene_type:complete